MADLDGLGPAGWPVAFPARALAFEGDETLRRGNSVLARLALVGLNDRVLDAAGALRPPDVRLLDAIHLATAQQLGGDLGRIVTYDTRMADAADHLGLRTVAPS